MVDSEELETVVRTGGLNGFGLSSVMRISSGLVISLILMPSGLSTCVGSSEDKDNCSVVDWILSNVGRIVVKEITLGGTFEVERRPEDSVER